MVEGSIVSTTDKSAHLTLDVQTMKKNYYKAIRDNSDVNKMYLQLGSIINSTREVCFVVLKLVFIFIFISQTSVFYLRQLLRR